ncbi:hypothetical protein AHF37_08860 [Paragonimus kellicotti]|nr:hypothetical protein AHF37_08860 [Paragonimus kellicotti]
MRIFKFSRKRHRDLLMANITLVCPSIGLVDRNSKLPCSRV